MTSSPSPSLPRRRTVSFGSSSSISTTYQDISSGLLERALAEVTTDDLFILKKGKEGFLSAEGVFHPQVRLASSGDLNNLLVSKAAAGWRCARSHRSCIFPGVDVVCVCDQSACVCSGTGEKNEESRLTTGLPPAPPSTGFWGPGSSTDPWRACGGRSASCPRSTRLTAPSALC